MPDDRPAASQQYVRTPRLKKRPPPFPSREIEAALFSSSVRSACCSLAYAHAALRRASYRESAFRPSDLPVLLVRGFETELSSQRAVPFPVMLYRFIRLFWCVSCASREPSEQGQFPVPGDPPSKTLSVIVPAHNEEDRLPGMLKDTFSYLGTRRKTADR